MTQHPFGQFSYESWKAKALAYAREEYALDANAIDDDWFTPDYNSGRPPEDSVDAFCEKYDLTRCRDFTLDQAFDTVMSVMRGREYWWDKGYTL